MNNIFFWLIVSQATLGSGVPSSIGHTEWLICSVLNCSSVGSVESQVQWAGVNHRYHWIKPLHRISGSRHPHSAWLPWVIGNSLLYEEPSNQSKVLFTKLRTDCFILLSPAGLVLEHVRAFHRSSWPHSFASLLSRAGDSPRTLLLWTQSPIRAPDLSSSLVASWEDRPIGKSSGPGAKRWEWEPSCPTNCGHHRP